MDGKRATRRASRWLCTSLLGASALACVGPTEWFAPRVDLQGHRGARGLAPENTLAAFELALALGVHTFELDTVLTRDDVVVISHDATLNPNLTRDRAGRFIDAPGPPIRSLTLAELQTFDIGRLRPGTRYAENYPDQLSADGQSIPSLAQLFELVERRAAADVRFNIETKLTPLRPDLSPEPEAFVRAVLGIARQHGMLRRVSLQSFDWRTLAAAQRIAPEVTTVYLSAQQSWANNVADARWTAGGEAHALGLRVVVWTVNEAVDIDKMLDLGVDGIISDRPDRVRAAFAARGWKLPRAYPGLR